MMQMILFVQVLYKQVLLLMQYQLTVIIILDKHNAQMVIVHVLSQVILIVEIMLEHLLNVMVMKKPLKLSALLKLALTKKLSFLIQIAEVMQDRPILFFVKKMIQIQSYQLVLTQNVLQRMLMMLGVEIPF